MDKKGIIFIFILITILFSCRGIKLKTYGEIIELKGFTAIRGKHCESTSMMNALNFQGLKLSEAMINGLASSMTTTFIKENGFPFLGGRVQDLKENFGRNTGIKIVEFQPKNSQEAYEIVKTILNMNIPVILRVDMRYLPYRHGGKYGPKYSSFGWHFVTIEKIDEVEGYAYVTETDEPGLRPVERIKISDLAKARDSREGFFKADNFCYYFESPSEAVIDYSEFLSKSLETVIYNLNSSGLITLKEMGNDILNIETLVKSKYMLKPLFYTFYGYIEIFGTGGSAFRNFYRDYLIETGEVLSNRNIGEYSKYVDDSCKKWKELALKFKYISENIEKYYNDENKRKELYTEAKIIASELYEAEKKMCVKLEELYELIK